MPHDDRDRQVVHLLACTSDSVIPWPFSFQTFAICFSPPSRMWGSLKLMSEMETVGRFLEVRYKLNFPSANSRKMTPPSQAYARFKKIQVYSRQVQSNVARKQFIYSSSIRTKSLPSFLLANPSHCRLSENFPLMNTVIPRLTKIIRSGITFVSRNLR